MTPAIDRLLEVAMDTAAEELEALLIMLAVLEDEVTWLDKPTPIWTDGDGTDTVLELTDMLCIIRLALVAELMTTTLLIVDDMDNIEEPPPLLGTLKVLNSVLLDIDEVA